MSDDLRWLQRWYLGHCDGPDLCSHNLTPPTLAIILVSYLLVDDPNSSPFDPRHITKESSSVVP